MSSVLGGVMTDQTWISTGKAARLMGYSRDHFREKFTGVIPSRRLEKGHTRWLASAVHELADQPTFPLAKGA